MNIMLEIFFFFTEDILYRKHANLLMASSEKYNLNMNYISIKKNGWQEIIAAKPKYIKNFRERCEKPFLYLDADACICEDISQDFSDIKEDIAVHYFKDTELLSGTIYFNKGERVNSLIDEWVFRMEVSPDMWDQKILQNIIDEWEADGKISVKKICASYTYIYDLSRHICINEPKIIHLQASRDSRWLSKFKKYNLVNKLKFIFYDSETSLIIKRHKVFNYYAKKLKISDRLSLLDFFL